MANDNKDFGVRLVRTVTAAGWAAALTYLAKHGYLSGELKELLEGAGTETVMTIVLGLYYTVTTALEAKLPAWLRRVLSGSAATPTGYEHPAA